MWHPRANGVEELEQSASVRLSVAYALECPCLAMRCCHPPVLQRVLPNMRWGIKATPGLLVLSKQD